MPRRVHATIARFADAKRQFRTTDVTLKDVTLVLPDGTTQVLPEVTTQLDVVRTLKVPAEGTLYFSDRKGAENVLFGLRLRSQSPTFDAGGGFDQQIANVFLLVMGTVLCWTILGAYLAWGAWKQRRVWADGKAARALFDGDAVDPSPRGP